MAVSRWIVVGLCASLAMPATAQPNEDRGYAAHEAQAVRSALSHIRTVTGQSALERMKACRFRIQRDASWTDKTIDPVPRFGLRAGDTTISVEFDRPAADPEMARDNLARWFIRGGKLTPDTGWAREIQFGPYPINKDGLSRC